jgi:hypothetical protein
VKSSRDMQNTESKLNENKSLELAFENNDKRTSPSIIIY